MARITSLPRTPASDLYCGRSVRSAEEAAKLLGADLLFTSAGLGWVRADTPIPAYGMSVVEGGDNVLARIEGGAGARDWWTWLGAHSRFATPLAEALAVSAGLVVVALPRAYLEMIEEELLALPVDQRDHLRIVQRPGRLLASLLPWTLLYDDRLGGGAGHAGTRSDFVARAAFHFAAEIYPGCETADAAGHAAAVERALAHWQASPINSGARRSDAEIRAIVTQIWDRAGGKTSQMLRIFRDELGVACEQGRFARLVRDMRTEREAG
ncbi:hypothetical protein [Sphingopyxis sp. JAI108]|uniref:hypothetical protein n=1 Tax=Sphingopyxis sp. JAI108 TaxID=2723060 RepID=UPI0015CEB954|nr:hypothetical protein [Sphingopyxis sp. JAI108]NYF30673.1 hypothetical protein [Sphingopyxis sp. JAI108]